MDKDLRKDIHRAFEKEYYEHARSGQRGVLKSVENAKSFFMKTLNHQSAFLSVITFGNAAIVGTALAMPSVGAVVFGPTVAIITFGISVTSTALLWASHISAVRKARRQMDEDIDSGKLLQRFKDEILTPRKAGIDADINQTHQRLNDIKASDQFNGAAPPNNNTPPEDGGPSPKPPQNKI